MIGKRLSGRYEIISKIGEGGMAIVYMARDLILDRIVAVKVLRNEFSHDNDFIRRFRREAESVASLSHSNIVSIYDIGEEEQIYFIVMEFVEGVTLKTYIKDFHPIPFDTIVYLMNQIGQALSHAHEFGIVHRDIKPHNILVNDDEQVKVTDFGIAIAVTSATITYTNAILGSAHYLSPEQAKGGKATEKSDIYSLGIVMYECLTGRLPFPGTSPVSVALMHLNEPIPRVTEMRENIPQSLENIVLRAMAKKPDQRYDSVNDFLRDLSTALQPNRIDEPLIIPDDNVFDEEEDPESEKTKIIPVIGSVKEAVSADKHQVDEPVKVNGNEKEKSKKRKRRFWGWFITIAMLIILMGTAAYLFMPRMFFINEVAIPNVAGKSYETANNMLRSKHLYVDPKKMTNESVPADSVIKQNPGADVKVKENTTVTLYVSTGPKKEAVDDYVGYDRATVEELLKTIDFKDTVWRGEASDTVPEGEVIKQKPSAGEKMIPKDTVIELTYSTGPPTSNVPDLNGLSKDEASAQLKNQGLDAQFTDGDYSDKVEKDHVLKQDPKKGSSVKTGTVVTVYLSKGSKPKPVTTTENISVKVDQNQDTPDNKIKSKPKHVQIYYTDAKHSNEKYKDETITETRNYTLKLTIDPQGEASYKVVVDDKTVEEKTINYDDVNG